jgi:hypothetical protein
VQLQEFFYSILGVFGITNPIALNVAVGVFFGIVASGLFYHFVVRPLQSLVKLIFERSM